MMLPFDRRYANVLLVFASVLAGGILLGGCTGRSTAEKPSAQQWQTTVVDDRFSFQMPGNPKVQNQKLSAPAGELDMRVYELQLDGTKVSYTFMVTDLPAAVDEPQGNEIEQRLDGAEQGVFANVKGKLLNREEIQISGFPGRDLVIEVPNAGIARLLLFLVRRTMIAMQVSNVAPEDANRFFQSLKLLNDSTRPESVKPQAKP